MTDFEISLARLKDVEPQDNWTEADWTHFKTIKKALEKQIPKKPTMKAMSGFEYQVAAKLVCLTCGNAVINYWNKSVNPPHCMMCGQALDWSDRERKENDR